MARTEDLVVGSPDVTSDAIANHEFEKTLRWWDGVTINMAMPAALFVSLGASIGAIGVWTAIALWAVTAVLATMHNWAYSEVAGLLPHKAGGVAVYANEAWKSRVNLVGPLATFAYWFAWSSSLAIYGLLIGDLVQAQWFPHTTWSFYDGSVHVGLPHLIAVLVIFLGWAANVLGMKPAVWTMMAMGVLLMIPIVFFIVLPFVTGKWSAGDFTSGAPGAHHWIGLPTALTWIFVMAWSVYGVEATASFVPEFKDTVRDTRLAMRGSALIVLAVYVLMPFGVSGLAGQKAIEADPTTFYGAAFARLFGGHGSFIMTVCLIAGLLLMMLMTSADGGRVLYGSSRDGLTLRQLGELNRFKVPGRAMTLDFVLNVILVLFLGNTLAILIAGNLGYVLMHVFAISGFLLLRKDRPNAPRPIKLGAVWTPIAAALTIVDLLLLFFGVTHSSVTGYGGTRELLIGIAVLSLSVVLYIYRVVVQDKSSLRWRSNASTVVPPDVQVSRLDEAVGRLEPAGE